MLEFFPSASRDEQQVIDTTRKLMETRVRPNVLEDDRARRPRREYFDAIAELGLHSLSHPKEYGGGGLPVSCWYAMISEIARASMSVSVAVSVTNLVQGALSEFGSPEQKERFYRPLLRGKWLGAFSLSEPQSGSDAAALRLAAKKCEGGYRLTGTKCWVSNSGLADLYLVMGRTGEHKTNGITSFLVPKDTKGFSVGKRETKLGLHSSTLAELIFEDAFIPEEQRLGEEGEGLTVALSQLDAGRIAIAAVGFGTVVEALERFWRFRTSAARKGWEFSDGIRHLFAEYFAHAQAVYCLIREAAIRRQQGDRVTVLAAQAKLLSSELAMRVTGDAVQYMGEAGMVVENEMERLFRDAKCLQIVEGTSQIQRLVLSREMDRMMES